MKAGIVVYRRSGTSLAGEWAHADTGGVLAKETVHDVRADTWEGDWPVEILTPDGQLLFAGRLNSVRLGDCLRLAWQGNFLQDNKPGTFQGLGRALGDDLMVASFEQTESEAK
jgi:hypothetical protein